MPGGNVGEKWGVVRPPRRRFQGARLVRLAATRPHHHNPLRFTCGGSLMKAFYEMRWTAAPRLVQKSPRPLVCPFSQHREAV